MIANTTQKQIEEMDCYSKLSKLKSYAVDFGGLLECSKPFEYLEFNFNNTPVLVYYYYKLREVEYFYLDNSGHKHVITEGVFLKAMKKYANEMFNKLISFVGKD